MNKEKGIYELLPSEPVDVAAMLIKATVVTDAPVFALSPMLEGKLVAIPKYDPVQLQEIAEHLLVYCNAQDYLKAGDILLNDNHHVAIAVTTGAKVSTSSTTLTGTFQTRLPILRKGSSGTAVAMLQAMLGVEVDGQFGNDTYDSLKVFQKNVGVKANGTCGIDTWKKVIEHMKANTK